MMGRLPGSRRDRRMAFFVLVITTAGMLIPASGYWWLRRGGPPRARMAAADFTVPDGDHAMLLRFIQQLRAHHPTPAEADHLPQFMRRRIIATDEAAKRILATAPSRAVRMQAISYRAECMRLARQFKTASVLAQEYAFLSHVAADSDPSVAALVRRPLLTYRLRHWPQLSAAEKADYFCDVFALAAESVYARDDRELIGTAASQLEDAGSTAKAAALYEIIADRLETLDPSEPQQRLAEQCKGALRRFHAVGKVLELGGVLFDGRDFEWSTLRGRIVVINFFAQWCQQSVEETKLLRDAYARYHSRGLEVVTVGLDSESAMEAFINEQGIRWPVLFCDQRGCTGWSQAIVTDYGITRLPVHFVIDRDGRVARVTTRNKDLGEFLRAAFGEAA